MWPWTVTKISSGQYGLFGWRTIEHNSDHNFSSWDEVNESLNKKNILQFKYSISKWKTTMMILAPLYENMLWIQSESELPQSLLWRKSKTISKQIHPKKIEFQVIKSSVTKYNTKCMTPSNRITPSRSHATSEDKDIFQHLA